MKRSLLKLALVCMLGQGAYSAERPNIVMLFSDDQRADAVGYVGNDVIQTPNLDRLANQGTVFNNCFVNTSICCVSRANLLTGQYPEQHGIRDFHKAPSSNQLQASVPGRLQKAGYQTAFFGKWGIGDTPENTHQGAKVFDYWAGQPKQTNFFHEADCRYVRFNGYSRPLNDLCDCPPDARGKKAYDVRIGKANMKDPLHMDSTIIPMQVDRFLDGRKKEAPFCMMVHFKSPHGPFQDYDPETENYTDDKTMHFSQAATMENAKGEPEVVKKSLGWKAGQDWLKNPKVRDMHLRNYYRAISSMDLGIGKILKTLKERGLLENTVFLFTSDNGMLFTEHGSMGKWLMYEPSLQVPGFIYDPREPKGKTTNRMVITTDFSVTMLALAGLDKPDTMTGRDLTRLQENPKAEWREDFFYSHPYAHGGVIAKTVGVRNDGFSYTRYINSKPHYEQLFDLRKDPDQLVNLAEDPKYKERLLQLRQRCDALKSDLASRR